MSQSLQQFLAEVDSVEILLWSAVTAPSVLKCKFAIVPDNSVIAVISEIVSNRRWEEIEGILILSTSWKMLQRVFLEDRVTALLFIPAED